MSGDCTLFYRVRKQNKQIYED